MEPFEDQDLGLTGLRPKAWMEPAPGTFGRMQSGTDSTSLALLRLPIDGKETLARVTKTFGLGEAPPVIERFEANGLEWKTYRTDAQGAAVDLAIAEVEGGTLVVVLTSSAAEHEALYASVLVPAVSELMPSVAHD